MVTVVLKFNPPLFADFYLNFMGLELFEEVQLPFALLCKLQLDSFAVEYIIFILVLFGIKGHSVLLVNHHELLLDCIADLLRISLDLDIL
jgi:hypothetical protein